MIRSLLFLLIAFALVTNNSTAQQFVEIDKIIGDHEIAKNKNLLMGADVAIFEDIAVVGSPGYDNKNGMVEVFRLLNEEWVREAILESSVQSTDRQFGRTIAIWDNVIAVADGKPDDSSAVYVFLRKGDTWESGSPDLSLDIYEGVTYLKSVSDIAISEGVIAIGANELSVNGSQVGTVQVFEKTGLEWTEGTIRHILSMETQEYSELGNSVAIEGDVIVAGAPYYSGGIVSQGAVVVFEKGDKWQDMYETAVLSSGSAESYEKLGYWVDIEDDVIVTNGLDMDGVSLFQRAGANWVDDTTRVVLSVDPNAWYGLRNVAIHGDVVMSIQSYIGLVMFEKPIDGWISMQPTSGVPTVSPGGYDEFDFNDTHIIHGNEHTSQPYSNSGIAIISEKTQDGWDVGVTMDTLAITLSPTLKGNYFGNDVAIDGDVAVVGSLDNFAQVFELQNNQWELVATLTTDDGETFVAKKVDIGGDLIVIGSDVVEKAYVYIKPSTGWADMTQNAILTGSDWEDGDKFAIDLATDGKDVIIGSQEGGWSWTGAVYVYESPIDSWTDRTESMKIVPSGLSSFPDFATSVAISDGLIVAGCPEHQGVLDWPDATGMAYLFEKNDPNGKWSDGYGTYELTGSDLTDNSGFGESVYVDGDLVVVQGNWGTYLFDKPENGWGPMSETARLTTNDGYGIEDVAIDNGQILGGRPFSSSIGYVYIYNEPIGGWVSMTETDTISPSDTESFDNYGEAFAVSISAGGGNIIIGANEPISEGSVYFFEDQTIYQEEVICLGDSILVGTEYISTEGVYNDTLQSGQLVRTTVSVYGATVNNASLFICWGDSVLLEDAYRTTAGTYTDTLASVEYGCDSIVATILTINVAPTVELSTYNPDPCVGEWITFYASGGLSYIWDNGSTDDQLSHYDVQAGTLSSSVTGYDINGCAGSGSMTLNVIQGPEIEIISGPELLICEGGEVTLDAQITNGESGTIEWYQGSTVYSNGDVVGPLNSYTYYDAIATSSNGCQDEAYLDVLVEDCNTSIDEQTAETQFKVFPNPSAGEFKVQPTKFEMYQMDILNNVGQVVFSGQGNGQQSIGTNLDPGVYIIRFIQAGAISYTSQHIR